MHLFFIPLLSSHRMHLAGLSRLLRLLLHLSYKLSRKFGLVQTVLPWILASPEEEKTVRVPLIPVTPDQLAGKPGMAQMLQP